MARSVFATTVADDTFVGIIEQLSESFFDLLDQGSDTSSDSKSDDGDSHPSRECHMVQPVPVLVRDGFELENPTADAPEGATPKVVLAEIPPGVAQDLLRARVGELGDVCRRLLAEEATIETRAPMACRRWTGPSRGPGRWPTHRSRRPGSTAVPESRAEHCCSGRTPPNTSGVDHSRSAAGAEGNGDAFGPRCGLASWKFASARHLVAPADKLYATEPGGWPSTRTHQSGAWVPSARSVQGLEIHVMPVEPSTRGGARGMRHKRTTTHATMGGTTMKSTGAGTPTSQGHGLSVRTLGVPCSLSASALRRRI